MESFTFSHSWEYPKPSALIVWRVARLVAGRCKSNSFGNRFDVFAEVVPVESLTPDSRRGSQRVEPLTFQVQPVPDSLTGNQPVDKSDGAVGFGCNFVVVSYHHDGQIAITGQLSKDFHYQRPVFGIEVSGWLIR